ncbi:branched-chain amino acid ABC transporter permease, partial [Candidatus Bipolaricaulota bacterium]|nr:branched-chain amino acid ABC transporter permease [Candidatus Bipolaricaulota bacterium]
MFSLQDLVNVAVLGSTYSLIAVGLTMVYGILKILHIAHAGVYTLGAYMGFFIVTNVTSNFWVALLMGMISASLVGMAIFRGVYYYMLKESRIIPLIASIGLFTVMGELFRLVAGPFHHNFPANSYFPPVETKWFQITSKQGLIILLTATFVFALYWIYNKTKIGLAWRACSQDMDIAGSVGVNVNRAISLNFLIGSALAGAAGVLMALYRNSIYPAMGNGVAYKAFVVVVIGGFGSLKGSIAAGFLLALVETFLSSLEWSSL